MKHAVAVVGANYGDEGKGLLVDYWAHKSWGTSESPPVVVRHNGGAQAGHTVVTPEGRRHVFSHVGAGAFAGAETYLSQFFVINPYLFVKELLELGQPRQLPKIWVDPAAFVTTPHDMWLNQMQERRRGAVRHGSCGVGVNETVRRHHAGWPLTVGELCTWSGEQLHDWVTNMEAKYYFHRLLDLELEDYVFLTNVQASKAVTEWIFAAGYVRGATERATVDSFQWNPLIFEGAQGLLLDECRLDQWPHVTRSRTGLTNVVYLAKKMGVERLVVDYVSRSYLTRHGAGALPGEEPFPEGIVDSTNKTTEWQGSLRYASLNLAELSERVQADVAAAKQTFNDIRAAIVFTCCDQVDSPGVSQIYRAGLRVGKFSYGPTRNDVSIWREAVGSRQP